MVAADGLVGEFWDAPLLHDERGARLCARWDLQIHHPIHRQHLRMMLISCRPRSPRCWYVSGRNSPLTQGDEPSMYWIKNYKGVHHQHRRCSHGYDTVPGSLACMDELRS